MRAPHRKRSSTTPQMVNNLSTNSLWTKNVFDGLGRPLRRSMCRRRARPRHTRPRQWYTSIVLLRRRISSGAISRQLPPLPISFTPRWPQSDIQKGRPLRQEYSISSIVYIALRTHGLNELPYALPAHHLQRATATSALYTTHL